jgi:hypothetical protein
MFSKTTPKITVKKRISAAPQTGQRKLRGAYISVSFK